jgi:putative ABC transport system ATP-binding protein
MKNNLIELKEVCVSYVNPLGENFFALKQVNLQIKQGEYVAILGPSGSGKTTLSNIIGLLLGKYDGDYLYNGEVLKNLSLKDQVRLRSDDFGFIFQDYILLDHLSALENVALSLQFHNIKKSKILDLAREKLISVGLEDKIHHRPFQLSGGQKQRVAIARALIKNPKVIIADEPTGALDHTSRGDILSILQKLNHDGVTILTVTHSDEDALASKRIIKVNKGELISDTIQRSRSYFFGKHINYESIEEVEKRQSMILNHLKLTYGLHSLEELIELKNTPLETETLLKVIHHVPLPWLKNSSVQDLLFSWFDSSEEIIKVSIALFIIKARSENFEFKEFEFRLKSFFNSQWTEEGSMHFLTSLPSVSPHYLKYYLRSEFFFTHESSKVRATAVNLFKIKGLFSVNDILRFMDTLLTDPDARVRANMLDFLLAEPIVDTHLLDKYHFHSDPSSRVKASWIEILMARNQWREGMDILDEMLLSDHIPDIQAAVWVLAKDPKFQIRDFISQQIEKNVKILSSVDEIISTYNRVKDQRFEWMDSGLKKNFLKVS